MVFFAGCFQLALFLALVQAAGARRVLLLGGNGFMGGELATRLIQRGDDVTVLNRGNHYYDSATRTAPHVRHIACDRDKALRLECPELLTSGHYDAVVDFSSYKAQQIQQVAEILRKRTDLYIFISTDSVYEVCNKSHSLATREEDAVRPDSSRLRAEFSKTKTYGHGKLACEEVLRDQFLHGGFPYVILRLPDVIGPRDSTLRWWTYQIWLRVHKDIEHPVHLPEGVSQAYFSLVHSDDVIKTVLGILDRGDDKLVQNQAFNLAFEEKLTLEKVLADIAEYLGIRDPTYHIDEQTAWYTYPTTTRGPLDTTKAKALLKWEPLTWSQAVQRTCDFYEGAMKDGRFAEERGMLFAEFLENIVEESFIDRFVDRLVELYSQEVLLGMELVDDDTPAIAGPPVRKNPPAKDGQDDSAAKDEL